MSRSGVDEKHGSWTRCLKKRVVSMPGSVRKGVGDVRCGRDMFSRQYLTSDPDTLGF